MERLWRGWDGKEDSKVVVIGEKKGRRVLMKREDLCQQPTKLSRLHHTRAKILPWAHLPRRGCAPAYRKGSWMVRMACLCGMLCSEAHRGKGSSLRTVNTVQERSFLVDNWEMVCVL